MVTNIKVSISLIIFFLIFFFVRKSKIVRKKLILVVLIIIWFFVLFLMSVFPIENAFINFSTPESVFFNYTTGDMRDIIYGKDSCVILYYTDVSSHSYLYIPIDEDGYNIPSTFQTKKVAGATSAYGYFEIVLVKGTNDYYLTAMLFSHTVSSITDSESNDINYNKEAGIVYHYIENYTEDYSIIIDGQQIDLHK